MARYACTQVCSLYHCSGATLRTFTAISAGCRSPPVETALRLTHRDYGTSQTRYPYSDSGEPDKSTTIPDKPGRHTTISGKPDISTTISDRPGRPTTILGKPGIYIYNDLGRPGRPTAILGKPGRPTAILGKPCVATKISVNLKFIANANQVYLYITFKTIQVGIPTTIPDKPSTSTTFQKNQVHKFSRSDVWNAKPKTEYKNLQM